MTEQASTARHPRDTAIKRIKAESKNREQMGKVQRPNGFCRGSSRDVGGESGVVNAEKDTERSAYGVGDGDQVCEAKVSDKTKVSVVVVVLPEQLLLFLLHGCALASGGGR